MLEEFNDKFQVANLMVARHRHWVLSVRLGQPTLGSLVLSANRENSELATMTQDESKELGLAMKLASGRLTRVFDPIKINVLCLMLVDPLVHFHIIPRYDRKVMFANREWIDDAWPSPVDLTLNQADTESLQLIKEALESA